MKTNRKKFSLYGFLATMIIVSLMLSCSDSTEPTQVVFTALPFASDDFALGYAEGINNDGTVVMGGGAVDTPDGKYFEIAPVVWTEDEITVLPFMGDPIPGFARQATVYEISNTGLLIGNEGVADLTPLGYYYANDQWQEIVDPATALQVQTAHGISGDGNTIVGLTANAREEQGGYYYNVTTGMLTILKSTFADSVDYTDAQTSLFDISEDGTIMVGSDFAQNVDNTTVILPMYYDIAKDTLPTLLPLTTDYVGGEATAISRDGSTIVGTIFDEDETPYAAYWDASRQIHVIGTFSPYPGPHQPETVALAASNNGDIIVGTSYDMAFIKFKSEDMISLEDWLDNYELSAELEDWVLYAATAITPDGHYIAGTGRDGAYTRAFKVYLP